MSVEQNLQAVREKIERAGRNPDDITIVAVTKGFGPEVCRAALGAGLTVLGENRVHEALTKMAEVDGAEWHLIGHLQTNKARLAAGRFQLIQSVDSLRLAEHIARIEPTQQVLVEVNVAREPQKSGVASLRRAAPPPRRSATEDRTRAARPFDGDERRLRGRPEGRQHDATLGPGALRPATRMTNKCP